MSNRTARSGANYAHKAAPDYGPANAHFLIGDACKNILDAGSEAEGCVKIQLLVAVEVMLGLRFVVGRQREQIPWNLVVAFIVMHKQSVDD